MADLDFGDEVRVVAGAPAEFRPGSDAWVVGLPTPGRDLVVIEFEDGSSMVVPPEDLRRRSTLG
jgi:hypothetical protein